MIVEGPRLTGVSVRYQCMIISLHGRLLYFGEVDSVSRQLLGSAHLQLQAGTKDFCLVENRF